MDELLRQTVQRGKHRHADDHAGDAQQIPAHDDGEQHPQSRNADGLAQDLRADKVAVKLLDDQNQDAEDQRLDGVDQQQDEDAGHRANKRAEHRDNVGDADEHADQHSKVQPQHRHADKSNNADDGGVDDLADEETGEIIVGIVADAQRLLGRTAGQQRVGHGAQLVQQVLLVCQHVDAGCNRRKDIDEVARHIAHGGHDLRQGRFA